MNYIRKKSVLVPSLVYFILVVQSPVMGNNLRLITLPEIVEFNNAGGYAVVEFSLSWDNSWRTAAAPNNWDAVWVFMKWQKESAPEEAWGHCNLGMEIHHAIPSGFEKSQPDDNTGIFLFHSSATSGPVTATLNDVRLQWDFSALGSFEAGEQIEIKVFAVEMVYVPEGSFIVGSGGSTTGEFYAYGNTSSTFPISSEDAINVGTTNGYLYYSYDYAWEATGDQSGPIPASFPKGYEAFYCMKYEITQGLYADFLNTLTRTQQNSRTNADISATTPEKRFVMNKKDIEYRRNGIRCDATLDADLPITIYCDFNENGIGNESNDGQSIASNFHNWEDFAAILDWMALRPMTELEYEKACRGPETPVPNEYAWGSTTLTPISSLNNTGAGAEMPSNIDANARYDAFFEGPIRAGAFAGVSTNRTYSGASYYGVMDLTGNVHERLIGVGHSVGRSFTGLHGDGQLDSNGEANVGYWPATTLGSGKRGGSYASESGTLYTLEVSNRLWGSWKYASYDGRGHGDGGRGVRTAP